MMTLYISTRSTDRENILFTGLLPLFTPLLLLVWIGLETLNSSELSIKPTPRSSTTLKSLSKFLTV